MSKVVYVTSNLENVKSNLKVGLFQFRKNSACLLINQYRLPKPEVASCLSGHVNAADIGTGLLCYILL